LPSMTISLCLGKSDSGWRSYPERHPKRAVSLIFSFASLLDVVA
jgi:hypothetical protein